MFLRTRQHLIEYPTRWVFAKSVFFKEDIGNGTEYTITKPDMSWGTFFRAAAIDEENNWLFSDIIDINSFIASDDLDKILEYANVEDISNNPVSININNRTLIIDSEENIILNVYNINGTPIFSGQIYGHMEIPINPPLIFIRLQNNNHVTTKKIIVK